METQTLEGKVEMIRKTRHADDVHAVQVAALDDTDKYFQFSLYFNEDEAMGWYGKDVKITVEVNDGT